MQAINKASPSYGRDSTRKDHSFNCLNIGKHAFNPF